MDPTFPQREGQEVTVKLDSVKANGRMIHSVSSSSRLKPGLEGQENNKGLTEKHEGERKLKSHFLNRILTRAAQIRHLPLVNFGKELNDP